MKPGVEFNPHMSKSVGFRTVMNTVNLAGSFLSHVQ